MGFPFRVLSYKVMAGVLEELIPLAFGVASESGPEILSQTPFLLTSIDWINSVPVCMWVC